MRMEGSQPSNKLPLINLRNLLTDLKNSIEPDLHMRHDEIRVKDKLSNADHNYFNDIANRCSPQQAVHEDYTIENFSEVRAINARNAECDVQAYHYIIKYKTQSKFSPFRKTPETYKMIPMAPIPDTKATFNHASKPSYYNELLISVRFYIPGRAARFQENRPSKFSEEFVCLGSNFLTELRDKIPCICNKYRFFDISEDPETPLVKKEADPGFFFITDTFYTDNRNSANPDYSEVIRKWAETAPGLSKMSFNVAKMEDTRFIDLTVIMGHPQVYQHHGNCEHVFTFSQVELLAPNNVPAALLQTEPSVFPKLRSFNLYNSRPCLICNTTHTSFMVVDSDRQLYDTVFLCKPCFFGFHYINGKKIGKFKAYRISDDNHLEDLEEEEENGEESRSQKN